MMGGIMGGVQCPCDGGIMGSSDTPNDTPMRGVQPLTGKIRYIMCQNLIVLLLTLFRKTKTGKNKIYDIDLYNREDEKVIVNLKTGRTDQLVQTLPAVMSKGTVLLTAVNNTDKEWKIDKSQMMGSLDYRSLGCFHIARNSLQRIMVDNADFLTDSETVEYFNILKEDHKNVMKFAQEAVLKKQQEMTSERNTKLKSRQSKGKDMIVICLKMMTLIHG